MCCAHKPAVWLGFKGTHTAAAWCGVPPAGKRIISKGVTSLHVKDRLIVRKVRPSAVIITGSRGKPVTVRDLAPMSFLFVLVCCRAVLRVDCSDACLA
jgi:hypothetical protein